MEKLVKKIMKDQTIYKKLMEISEAPLDSPSQLPFSSIEARRLAEKDVMKIGKIIGKASAQSIKVMMDGVKSGGYDALDLQRSIMSGPAKRAGTGQIELMRTLWNRVRDGFRRYMKRGKLRN